jgi:hypothetical protein
VAAPLGLWRPALACRYAELKKEKWAAGATVKDRAEPAHIVHVLQVLSGARRAAAAAAAAASEEGSGHGPTESAEQEVELAEAGLAAAAYANSLRTFWPDERS